MRQRGTRLTRILWGALLAQLLVLVTGFGVWTWVDFTDAGKDAAREIENAGLLLEEHVLRSLAAIDAALLQTADLVHETGPEDLRGETAWRRLRSIARALPRSGAIFVYDPHGDTLAASTTHPAPVFNASGREYFRHLAALASDRYVGRALKGRTVHQFFFPVARAIKTPDGRLRAVAQVGVEVDYIADLFTKAQLGGKAFGLYLLSDGNLVVRHPMTERLLGESVASQPFFSALSAGTDLWTGWVGDDTGRRLATARRVGSLPLLLTASMPHEEVFEQAYDQLAWRGAGLLAGIGVLVTLAVMLFKSVRREERSQKALRDVNQRYELVLEGSQSGIWDWDVPRRKVLFSRVWKTMRGHGEQEIGDDEEEWSRGIHPEDAPRVTAAVQAHFEGRTPVFDEEYRVRRKDGSWMWIADRGVAQRDAAGRVVRMAGSETDITGRKQAEERARREHRRTALTNRVLRAFVEHREDDVFDRALAVVRKEMGSRYGVFGYIRPPGHLICPSLSKLLDTCEVEGKCIRYPPEKWKGLWARALTEKRAFYSNEAPPVPPGHPVIHNNLVTPILFHGEVIGLLNLANKDGGYNDGDRDTLVTLADRVAPVLYAWIQQKLRQEERLAAEAALRESEERLRRLSDNLPDSAVYQYVHEPDGNFRFVYFSSGIERLTGLRAADVLGDPDALHRQLEPGWLERLVKAEARSRDDLSDFDMELPLRRPDGRVRWMRLHSRPRRLPDGGTIWDGVQTDITERKQAEDALWQVNATLEQQVTERTRLAEDRARQLQVLAVELIEAEERERRRIAEQLHEDLQQMLAAARMRLESRVPPDEETLSGVREILVKSIEKSRRLSHELSPPVLQHADLVAALEWLAHYYNEQFGLRVAFDGDVAPPAESEPVKMFLFRAAQELLFNVVKHAGVKSARVDLKTENGWLVLVVSDRGRGLREDILDSGTAPFGLGLLSLRERASHIGGSLVIASEPGLGSRFTLKVPHGVGRADEMPPAAASESVDTPVEAAGEAGPGVRRVLFVDDHKVMRQGLINLIGRQPGIQVVGEASNGREAVDRVRLLHPDVVVMDVSMPEMDGIEATRHIKAQWPRVRVIALSMFADEHVFKAMREAGAEAFVSKTASSAELLRTIYGN